MFAIDHATAAEAEPARPDAGTAGYFTDGNPGSGTPATIVPAWFLNMLQKEVLAVLDAADIAPDKDDDTQLAAAIAALIAEAVGDAEELLAASQAEMEAATATDVYVTPGRQHFHPSAAKAWAAVNNPAGVPAIGASYNCSSVVDNAPGDMTINLTTAFSNTNFAALATARLAAGTTHFAMIRTKTTTSIQVTTANAAGVGDVDGYEIAAFGDHA